MAIRIETSEGGHIASVREWRAHVFDSDRNGLARFFDGLNELACTWCAGGSHGVPEEVTSLLKTGWPEVNTTRIVATPQIATGVGAARFWADVMLNVGTSAGGLVVIVLAGKRAYESEAQLVDAEPTLAEGIVESVLGRSFLKSGRPDSELAMLPLRLFMATAAALHTAKMIGASAAAVVIHEIVTPATFKDDIRLGRSMLMAFARAMGSEDLQPGVMTRVAARRAQASTAALWLGCCVREMPAVPWIVKRPQTTRFCRKVLPFRSPGRFCRPGWVLPNGSAERFCRSVRSGRSDSTPRR